MKNLFATVVAVAVLATPASAAGAPKRNIVKAAAVAPVYDWSGFFAGVNGGAAWGNRSGALESYSPALETFVAAGRILPQLGADHAGGFGGAQAGYNWQRGRWVFGLEADLQGALVGNAHTVFLAAIPAQFSAATTSARDRVDWFATGRGRIGFAVDNVLVYGTGGLAYGEVRSSVSAIAEPATTGNFNGSVGDRAVGWAAGAGAEWGISAHWLVRAEYLHVDLGRSQVTITDPQFPGIGATYLFSRVIDTARVAISYKF